MARSLLLLLFLLTLLAHIFTTTAESSDNCGGRPFTEKQITLHFFWHNRLGPPNQTAVPVARSPTTNNSSTLFGLVNVIDDPITFKPQESSGLLGKSQGIYVSVDQNKLAAFMIMAFVFVEGEYSGSTLTLLGRNEELLKVRELPIVGGTGIFRFARGYCELSTYSIDGQTAVVEYHCYVLYNPRLISEF